MDILTSLLIIGFAALIHASFQLSVSVLTLLSGHAIGARRSHSKLMRMTFGFIVGNKVMTLLLITFFGAILINTFGVNPPQIVWISGCGLVIGLGIAVWLFYYRRGQGTSLWIPRSFARYLNERSKVSKSTTESFSLGLTTVLSELLFIVGPLFIAGLALVGLPGLWQLVGIVLYTFIATIGSLIVWVLIGSGHKLSRIQKWREKNKAFLQFVSGGALLVLGFYVYVNEVIFHGVGGL